MGRFISPDWSAKEDPVPYADLDDPQSLNLYAYVRNNPVVHVDADGHDDGPFSTSFEPTDGPACLPNPFHPIVPYPAKYSLTTENVEKGLKDAASSIASALRSAANTVVSWFSKSKKYGVKEPSFVQSRAGKSDLLTAFARRLLLRILENHGAESMCEPGTIAFPPDHA